MLRETIWGEDASVKILAIIVNILAPGIGTLLVKKWWQAFFQIVLVIIAIVLNVSGVGAILGIPIAFVAWVWAIVSAATAQPQTGR
jgi:hypothetical protein